jgi:hypothetical protein
MFFYSSLAPDSPQLNNTYGDFNKVLNYIIDGGTSYNIVKIIPKADKRAYIYYDASLSNCPWVLNQSITVAGSSTYSGTYLIESIDAVSKYVIGYNSAVLGSMSQDISTGITAKITPSGIQRVFGGVSYNRTVIRFADGIQYRFDDRDFTTLLSPNVTLDNSWAKVCRVSMSSQYDNLDFASTRIIPYNSVRPSENFTPSGNYIGQCMVTYNSNTGLNETSFLTSTTSGVINHYRIWANNYAIYIQIFPQNNYSNNASAWYIFGNINYITPQSNPNGIIMTRYMNNFPYTDVSYQSIAGHLNGNSPVLLGLFPNRSQAYAYIYNNGNNVEAPIGFSGEYGVGSTAPSGMNGTPNPNKFDNNLYFSDSLVIDTSNNVYGKLYDVKWMNSKLSPAKDTIFTIGNDVYMSFEYVDISSSYNTYGLIKLTRS